MNELLQAAQKARENAHCPYSGYPVGAAVCAADGSIYAGCNVENASYGLTICAERNAIAAMVAAGHTRLTGVLVLSRDGGMPCGACLQVIAEFATGPDVPVTICSDAGAHVELVLGDLLPKPFRLDAP